MKVISLLGSTGSIGRQTLEVVNSFPESIKVHSLAASTNVDLMEQQVRAFCPQKVVMMDTQAAEELAARVKDLTVQIDAGMEGLLNIVTDEAIDIVVSAISGRVGLEPTLAALGAGKDIALANKETLVAAGELVMKTAREKGCSIYPVDSEHSAIFQCLTGNKGTVSKIILTASGGPFLNIPLGEFDNITPAMALKHPNWVMGAKITIDSATMMNKGLEVIEAHYLFDMDYDKIEVIIHPQSIIHSMVEYVDGAVLAQLGRPDMRIPIQYALSFPDRWVNDFERLELKGQTLTFVDPDPNRFPALALAYRVGKQGGTLPAVMNAANEIAVGEFLNGKIDYHDIINIVGKVCTEHSIIHDLSLETIMQADHWARQRTFELAHKA